MVIENHTEIKCRCGEEATGKFELVIKSNIYSGLQEIETEKKIVFVCDYHAEKAKKLGYAVKSLD